MKTGRYDVTVTSSFDEFLALENEWNALWEQSEANIPMTSHLLYRTWWESYGAERQFVAATAREEGRLVAAGMFLRKDRGFGPFRIRLLRCFGPYHTGQRHGILHPRGRADAAVELILALRREPGWDAILLGRIDARWEQAETLRRALPATSMHRYPGLALVRLEGDFASFLAARSRNFRRGLRRAEQKILEDQDFRVEVRRGTEVDDNALARMIDVDRASWKGESIIGVASPERLDFFRRFLVAASERGWSRLYFLRHRERDVAFSYLLDAGSSVTGYKMSFAQEFAEYRPGAILLRRAIEDSFGTPHAVFDFFNYPAGYQQSHWYDEELPQVEIATYNRTPAGIPAWLVRRTKERLTGRGQSGRS